MTDKYTKWVSAWEWISQNDVGGRQNMLFPPQLAKDLRAFISRNCDSLALHGERSCADTIKVTDLKGGRVSWITSVHTV